MKTNVLDEIDKNLLELLKENARASYSFLAKEVNLSAPAVKERLLKLEDAGIISGYTVVINDEALGKAISALIMIDVPYSLEKSFIAFVEEETDIVSCHHLLGQSAFIAEVKVENTQHLEALIARCQKYGQTTTHVLLSQVKP